MSTRIPFELRDDSGALQAGVDLSGAGVVQISKHGAAFANRIGAAPTSVGGGLYYYDCDASEAVSPWIILKVVLATYQTVLQREDITSIDIEDTLTRLLGLHRENSLLDGGAGNANAQYNSNQLMTNGRLRVFDDKTNTDAATAGAADNSDGEIARYTITGVDNGSGLLGRMKIVREL